ncbi:hypothetical protein PFISCL1PPCAC_6656, partial [Pristionchus fissidentatus]
DRETLSGRTFFRTEIVPQIHNICEKYGQKVRSSLGTDFPVLLDYEMSARICTKDYYEKRRQQNIIPIPLEGPTDHFWLRGFDRDEFFVDVEYELYERDTEYTIEWR